MATAKRRFKFAAVWLVSLLVVGALGFTTWFAYHSEQVADRALQSANKVSNDIPKVQPITTFDACKKAAGSKLLQTYPEQCVTTMGKTFTDTSQPKYLVVKEWGVEFPYTGTDTFTYIVHTSTDNAITVISANLAKSYGCTTYGAGTIGRYSGSDGAYIGLGDADGETVAQAYVKHPGSYVKLGNHYYSFSHDQAYCSDKAGASAQNVANDTVKASVVGVKAVN